MLRRNAKDRMEFDEFFNHPFLRGYPAGVPTIAAAVCDNEQRNEPGTSETHSTQVKAQALPNPNAGVPIRSSGTVAIPGNSGSANSPAGSGTSNKSHPLNRVERIKKEEPRQLRAASGVPATATASPAAAAAQTAGYSTRSKPSLDLRNRSPKTSSADDSCSKAESPNKSSSSSGEIDDFVMINEDSISTTPGASSSPSQTSSASPTLSQRIYSRTLKPLVNYAMPEPIPVPTQRAAFEQIQRSSVSNSSSVGIIPEDDVAPSTSVLMTSPPSTPPQAGARLRQSVQSVNMTSATSIRRQDSCSSLASVESNGSRSSRNVDVSQMSPPSVNFILGSSPTAGLQSPSVSMNRSRRLSIPYPTYVLFNFF